MKPRQLVSLTTVILGAALVGNAMAAGDAAAGKEKSMLCASCHGENGQSSMPALPGMVVPNLAGQHADYIAKALHDYQSGARTNASMNGMAAGLSNTDIDNLAAYFSSLPGLNVVKKPE